MVELIDAERHVTATDEGVLVLASHLRVAGLHGARGLCHRLDRGGKSRLPRADLRFIEISQLLDALRHLWNTLEGEVVKTVLNIFRLN